LLIATTIGTSRRGAVELIASGLGPNAVIGGHHQPPATSVTLCHGRAWR